MDTANTAAAALQPGIYCYSKDDKVARLTVDEANKISGNLRGGSAGEESEYTLYDQVFEGHIVSTELDLNVTTTRRGEADTTEQEQWQVTSTELTSYTTLPGLSSILPVVDCEASGVNLVFDNE